MNEDVKLRAAEYVLGLFDASEAELGDNAFLAEVAFWEAALAPLEHASRNEVLVTPGEGVWGKIANRLDELESAPGTRTITLDAGVWETIGAGIERKVLHVNRIEKAEVIMVRMEKGSVLPEHEHAGDEHCVVLSGQLRVGGKTFGAGAYHFAEQGINHNPIIAETDAVFFIYGAL